MSALYVSPPVMTNSLLHPRLLEYTVIFDFQAPSVVYACNVCTNVCVQYLRSQALAHLSVDRLPYVSRRSPGIFFHVSDVTGRANYANVGIM